MNCLNSAVMLFTVVVPYILAHSWGWEFPLQKTLNVSIICWQSQAELGGLGSHRKWEMNGNKNHGDDASAGTQEIALNCISGQDRNLITTTTLYNVILNSSNWITHAVPPQTQQTTDSAYLLQILESESVFNKSKTKWKY